MKCTQCGNDKFFKSRLQGPTTFEMWFCDDFIPFVCEKCGHVELFAELKVLDEHANQVKKVLAEQEFNKAKSRKIEELTQEIQRLEKIIADENNTVKVVNAAKEDLKEKSRALAWEKMTRYQEK